MAQSDYVFVTNNNPRTEDPSRIAEETVAGFRPAIHRFEDVPGLSHWLVDVNEVPEIPSDFVTRDRRIANQGLVTPPPPLRFVHHFDARVIKTHTSAAATCGWRCTQYSSNYDLLHSLLDIMPAVCRSGAGNGSVVAG